MDANNIGAQIISLNQPTAQAFTDVEQATEFCQKANQFVYDNYVTKYPGRFFAFATLPTQSGKAAAAELERCVKDYDGFVGAMINGFTATTDPEVGLYLDHPQFDALWEVAERLQKPIFIHPRVPLPSNIRVLDDIPTLHGAPYGFARETVEHIFRIMYTGVFDRFPGLKICLGHMGEGLSWILPRTDTTFRMYSDEARGPKKHSFLHYFQENIITNTSGMPRTSALMNLMAEAKVSNIMFSVDYPYESIAEMREWFESVPVSDETWKDIGYRNAIRLFQLPLNYDN
ncbi:metal-dependent hydrolase [Thozetella sp. PMI_491]|nr:metal-dependent hydrolase [Thozetella sp. PMI_491]